MFCNLKSCGCKPLFTKFSKLVWSQCIVVTLINKVMKELKIFWYYSQEHERLVLSRKLQRTTPAVSITDSQNFPRLAI